jgi:transposase
MLRRVSSENASVTDASDEYGVSRPTHYQATSNFDEAGIAGLVPKKRGPHGPHKIYGEVLAFLRTQFVPGEPIRARELARLIRQEFDLDVHPRTIERTVSAVIAQYETLRMATLDEALPLKSRSGLALFLRRGVW